MKEAERSKLNRPGLKGSKGTGKSEKEFEKYLISKKVSEKRQRRIRKVTEKQKYPGNAARSPMSVL